MVKNLTKLLFLFSLNIISQTGIDLGLNGKKGFVSIKTLDLEERKNITDYFITDNDTLVHLKLNLTKNELKLFCDCYTNDSLVKAYRKAVFRVSMKHGRYRKSNQWISAINIYFDKSIPRKVKKEFIKFYEPLNSINNLDLNFISNISNANYIIIKSDTLIKNYESNLATYDEIHPLSKGGYKIITDKNNKFYGATLNIDTNRLKDKTLILPKLKQLFFFSLGQFIFNKDFPKTSLLSTRYKNSATISEDDLNLLKMHYFKIFDKQFTIVEFNKLLYKSKLYCSNE